MSVKIRLSRVGKKKVPNYRIVVADQRSKRDGRVIERIGNYDPRSEAGLVLKTDRVQYWMEKGAKPSSTVARLIKRSASKA